MASMATALMVEPKVSERLILALVLSIGLHVAILFTIQAKPNPGVSPAAAPITATLERSASTEDSTVANADPEVAPSVSADPVPVPKDEAPAIQAQDSVRTAPATAQSALKPEPVEPSTALEVPVIRDPTFYAARFLDEYPRPLTQIEPRYPVQASRAGVTGKVTLLLLIDEHGTLHEISVVEAAPEAVFDEAALAAFRDVRFAPARKDGRAVRSRVLITVGFEANKPASLQ